MNFDYAIHSDFLIHWTGKDIDNEYDEKWYESDKSKTNKNCDVTDKYIDRLYDILQFGLWMTEETKGNEESLCFGGEPVPIPKTPKTCFTELKLSESRKHARQYGRLGIGVKRPFLFERWGRPLIYYLRKQLDKDIFLKNCVNNLEDKKLLNFFKPMNRSGKPLTYDLYAESEWRILLFQELLREGLIVNPQDPKNKKEYNYFMELSPEKQAKLKYLIPLNGWFAMIIHPSLDVKNKAQEKCVRQEIEKVKAKGNVPKAEAENGPIEVDLDACRNF